LCSAIYTLTHKLIYFKSTVNNCQEHITRHNYSLKFILLSCFSDINECLQVPPICLNGGICEDGPGTYTCTCAQGYKGPECGDCKYYKQTHLIHFRSKQNCCFYVNKIEDIDVWVIKPGINGVLKYLKYCIKIEKTTINLLSTTQKEYIFKKWLPLWNCPWCLKFQCSVANLFL
jgi:hypothetical protein